MKHRSLCLKLSISFLAFLLCVESFLRLLGFSSIPVFDSDIQVGYFSKPSQSGVFFGGKDWFLNEHSLLNKEPFFADRVYGTLVISDSIVWGGVAYEHNQKIGPQLQSVLGPPWRVWSIGAGSWSALNELTWMSRNSEVVNGVSTVVWLFNSGDFGGRSLWASNYTHPKKRPFYLTGYLLLKYLSVKPWWPIRIEPIVMENDLDAISEIRSFCLKNKINNGPRIILIGYPDREEINGGALISLPYIEKLSMLAKEVGVGFYDLRQNKKWDATAYKDSIHPSIEGNARLAEIVADLVRGEF